MAGLKNVFPFWTSRMAVARTCEEVCLSKNPAAPNVDHLFDIGVITMRGEDEHLGVRESLCEFAGWLPGH